MSTEKKIVIISIAGVTSILLGMFLSMDRNVSHIKTADSEKLGEIKIDEPAPESDIVPYEPDKEWQDADEEYYEDRKYMIPIVDEDEQLSRSGFLSIKAHFMKSEAIGTYLEENGYHCEQVYVVPGSAKKDGNNSYFTISMDEYPSILIQVTYYGITESFAFEVLSKGE